MSAVILHQLRAEIDREAADLCLWYFDSHPEWITRMAEGDFSHYSQGLDRLVDNRRWDACKQLERFYDLCKNLVREEQEQWRYALARKGAS